MTPNSVVNRLLSVLSCSIHLAGVIESDLYQQRLEEEAGNHAGAIHTESHYKDELSKETAKRDALQDVANTVEFEFKVSSPCV